MRGARIGALVVLAMAGIVPAIGAPGAVAAPNPSTLAVTPNAGPISVSIPVGPSTTKVAIMGLAVEPLTISTSSGSFGANCDVQMTLRDPDGALIAGPTCAGQAGTIDITALPSDGSYTVALKSKAAAAGTLSLAARSNTGPVSITPDAPPISLNISGNATARLGFTAKAGERYSVALQKSYWTANRSCTFSVEIVDAGDVPVGNHGGPCTEGFVEPTKIPTTGTYYVEMTTDSEFTGRFLSPGLYRVVDTSAPIVPGAKPTPGAITVPGQTARFTFAGTAGQQFSALVTKSTMRSDCIVAFKRPDGSIAASTSCNRPGGFLDSFALDATGTWSAVVNPSGAMTGTFAIQVFDSTDQAGTTDLSGTPTAIDITQPGQNAVFTFAGTMGQRVSALLTDATFPAQCSTNQGFELALLRPDGSIAAVQLECGSPNPPTSSFIDATTLDQTGTWSFVVDPVYTGTGTAQLQTYSVVDQTGAAPLDGTPIDLDISAPGQNAAFTFNGIPGRNVSLALQTSDDFGPSCRLALTRPDASIAESATCSGASTFLEPFTLDMSGTWTVRVDPDGPATGTGTLRVSKVVDQQHPITPGGPTLKVAIAIPGQNASYSFTGASGDVRTVVLNASTFTGCSSVFVSFVRPNGSTLSIKGTCTANLSLGPVTLDATGVWTVLVDPVGATTGTAKLTLT